MSLQSRREYLATMHRRYRQARSRRERSAILDELVAVLGYHRKYAIQVLRRPRSAPAGPTRRPRPLRYPDALPVIQRVWEALDYPCAERLHPVLLDTAEHLARHGVVTLTATIRTQLGQISRATLARRIAAWPIPKARRTLPRPKAQGHIPHAVPIGRYDGDEQRPGALQIDLVEHNGGSTAGHYAYTLSVVDIVTHWSAHRAILGRSQAAVHGALAALLQDWPYPVWGLHTDNDTAFLNHLLLRFVRQHRLQWTRSRPYRKNDQPHVEQHNRFAVREVVGYGRYDSPAQIAWLNDLYALLDPYRNLFLPVRKVIAKVRLARGRVRKHYDTARTPLQRALDKGVIPAATAQRLLEQRRRLNPLALHQELERRIALGPEVPSSAAD